MSTSTTPDQAVRTSTARPWTVILYNDDVHAFDEVVMQVQQATGSSEEKAYQVTLEAHSRGKSVVFTGPVEECQRVARVLRRIRLQVEVDEG